MTTPDDRLLTSTEVGRILRVDAKTVTRWCKAGKLDHLLTPGGHVRVRLSVLRGMFR